MSKLEIEYIRHPFNASSKYPLEPCVLALGFFDGVHIGHQSILHHAKQIAEQKQLTFGVMTFFPHPKEIFNPTSTPMTYLSPLAMKEEQFRDLGVEKLYVIQFSVEFSQLSPEDFVQAYLIDLNCKHVVAGFDYHYGHKGSGNMETLKQHGMGCFDVTTIGKVVYEDQKISSTAIRQLLAVGDVQSIPAYLGRCYEVMGKVEQSSSYYSSDQFISVKIDDAFRLPANGVYDVIVDMEDKQYKGRCLQMKLINQQRYVLIRLSSCFSFVNKKHIMIKWMSFVISHVSENRDMDAYFIQNEAVAVPENPYYSEYLIC